MQETFGLYIPSGYSGEFILKPISELSPDERKEFKSSWDTPRVQAGNAVFADWQFLDFEHGRIYHVAQFSTVSGRLVGTRPEIVTKPAVVTLPMRVAEQDRPEFLSMVESRFFAFDLLRRPFDLYGHSSPYEEGFVTVPQGHVRMKHSNITSEGNNNRFEGLETITHAAFREMIEEAGYRGTGRFKILRRVYRDQSLSAAQVTFVLAEVGPKEEADYLGRKHDIKETITFVMWRDIEQLKKMRRKWSDWRAIVGTTLLEDYLESDYLKPETRFDGIFDVAMFTP